MNKLITKKDNYPWLKEFAFNKIFQDKLSLMSFVGLVLGLEVLTLELLDKNLYTVKDYNSKIDLKMVINDGTIVAFEIQRQSTTYFLPRLFYYMSSLIVSQIDEQRNKTEGKVDYNKIKKCIIVSIFGENVFTSNNITNWDKKKYETIVNPSFDGLEIPDNRTTYYFIELSKFRNYCKEIMKNGTARLSLKEQWLFILASKTGTVIPDYFEDLIRNSIQPISKKPTNEELIRSTFYNMALAYIDGGDALAHLTQLRVKTSRDGMDESFLDLLRRRSPSETIEEMNERINNLDQ
jgi:hypothetical protein